MPGKGEGLICCFHGVPGVGKTMTAEAISEHLRRPLYSIAAGELGLQASSLERSLKQIFDLATQWQAICLLDEADVFLEKRSSTELDRNSLVSIFLKALEYYSGSVFYFSPLRLFCLLKIRSVLILTTNRLSESVLSIDCLFIC